MAQTVCLLGPPASSRQGKCRQDAGGPARNSIPDLHVRHAFAVQLSAIGFDVHGAGADRIDMRIDGDAAEVKIARAQDVDMERIGDAVGDAHRARTREVCQSRLDVLSE